MAQTLQNEYLRVSIREQGAELTSLFNYRTQTEHLWQANPDVWPWHAPNLFPVVGNQTNNQLLVEGQTYPINRHGFARNSLFVCTETSPESATFELRDSAQTRLQYPYAFIFEISYQLHGPAVTVTYRVKNPASQVLYMSVGAHPAFNVPFHAGEVYTDYYLEFDHDDTLETNLLGADGLLSGQKDRLSLTNRQLPLTPDLFKNDALILLSLASRQVTLGSRKNSHSVCLNFGPFPFLGLWAKPGAPFVCIEPWLGVADTTNDPRPIEAKQGIQPVRPEEMFSAAFSITLS